MEQIEFIKYACWILHQWNQWSAQTSLTGMEIKAQRFCPIHEKNKLI